MDVARKCRGGGESFHFVLFLPQIELLMILIGMVVVGISDVKQEKDIADGILIVSCHIVFDNIHGMFSAFYYCLAY